VSLYTNKYVVAKFGGDDPLDELTHMATQLSETDGGEPLTTPKNLVGHTLLKVRTWNLYCMTVYWVHVVCRCDVEGHEYGLTFSSSPARSQGFTVNEKTKEQEDKPIRIMALLQPRDPAPALAGARLQQRLAQEGKVEM
jgi:hypothetical protein